MFDLSTRLSGTPAYLRDQFNQLNTSQDIAQLLEISNSDLSWHIYRRPPSDRYELFTIPKKSGGLREINAPIGGLKLIQWKLNQVLQAVYQPKPSVFGFVAGRNIVKNADLHKGQKHVLNLDLQDFFPSIHFGRVMGLFIAPPYERPRDVAKVLAQICCHNTRLPQGAPTSPVVSNMICRKMDSQLQRLASQSRCWYSRYADDLTFSTSLSRFPRALAEHHPGTGSARGIIEIGAKLEQVISNNGFSINTNKVRLHLETFRQEVTGLTVNVKPNVRRNYFRQIRAMLHAWEKFGPDAAERDFLSIYDVGKHRGPFHQSPSYRRVVRGRIEFLGMVRGHDDGLYLKLLGKFHLLNKMP